MSIHDSGTLAVNPLHRAVHTECDGFPSSLATRGAAEHPLHRALAAHATSPMAPTPVAAYPLAAIMRWLAQSWPNALLRAAIMVAGVGISLASLPRQAEPWLVAVCGVVAWATSHIIATVAWNGREHSLHDRDVHAPAAGALLALVPAGIVAAVVATTVGSLAVLNWVVWATILAAGSVLWTRGGRWTRWSLWIVAVGIACWMSLHYATTWVSNMVSMLTISVVGVRMFWWLLMNAQGAWSEGIRLLFHRATAAAVLRVLSVVPAWALVWQVGQARGFILVSWITMASAVASELLMPLAIAVIGRVAARAHRLAHVRAAAAGTACAMTALVSVVAAGAWVGLSGSAPSAAQPMAALAAVAALLILTHCVTMACGDVFRATLSTVVLGAVMAVVGWLLHGHVGVGVAWLVVAAATLGSVVTQVQALCRIGVWTRPYTAACDG